LPPPFRSIWTSVVSYRSGWRVRPCPGAAPWNRSYASATPTPPAGRCKSLRGLCDIGTVPICWPPWTAVTSDGRVLEVKTASSAEGWGEPGSDEIPDDCLCQAQHYLLVTGLKTADVAVLIGGHDFRLYEVAADKELQEIMAMQEAEFWQRVEAGDPPPTRSLADLALCFRHPLDAAVLATPQAIAAVEGSGRSGRR